MLNGFHRCQGFGGGGVSQAPGWLLHQLVEQNVALTGRHLVFTDRGDAGEKADGVGVGISAVDPSSPWIPTSPQIILPAAGTPGILLSQGCCRLGQSVPAAVGMGRGWRGRPFSPRVIVDMPTSLAPTQSCVVAVVDAARVVAEGIQLIDRASWGFGGQRTAELHRARAQAHTPSPSGELFRSLPPSRLTSFVTGKVSQAQSLQREIHTY